MTSEMKSRLIVDGAAILCFCAGAGTEQAKSFKAQPLIGWAVSLGWLVVFIVGISLLQRHVGK